MMKHEPMIPISGSGLESGIAALATPPGISALAVIRASGAKVADVCDALFLPAPSFPKPSEMAGYTLALGWWTNGRGERLDQVLLSAFRTPRSYTGEDLYEISCHGGYAARSAVLESLFEHGLRPAGPGEFTRRAFLNGRLDLTRAEAVMDLIEAESERQRQTALAELGGSLSRASGKLSASLYRLQAGVEMILEFPEHEDSPEARANLESSCLRLLAEIEAALASWAQGRVLRDGFRVVLCGLPNAGKSSLLNVLLGEERAIVHDLAGTTRDTVTETARIAGLPVRVTDTAGLRESGDAVEKEGIERAKKAAREADLLLWLHDPQQPEESLKELRRLVGDEGKGRPLLLLAAKSDLDPDQCGLNDLRRFFPDCPLLSWSDRDPAAAEALRGAIAEAYDRLGTGASAGILLHNLRHKRLLEEARDQLSLALSAFRGGLGLDLAAAMLRAAQENFAELRGEQVSDQLAEEIFSRFCVGK